MQAFLLILSLAIIVEALVQYAKTVITMLENKQYKTFGTQLAAILIAVFICFAAGADIFALMGISFSVQDVYKRQRAYHRDLRSLACRIFGLKMGRMSRVNTAEIVFASELHMVMVLANMDANTRPTMPTGRKVLVKVAYRLASAVA